MQIEKGKEFYAALKEYIGGNKDDKNATPCG